MTNEKRIKATPRRRRTLLVARESGQGSQAETLLRLLFQRVLQSAAIDDIDPSEFEREMAFYNHPVGEHVAEYGRGDTKAVLVRGEETGKDYDVLLSLGSARSLTVGGDNAFVETLIEILSSGDYDRVVTTVVSRLCRNEKLSGRLQTVLDDQRVTVVLGKQEIRVWEQTGSIIWQIMVWFAAFDAEQIELRTLAGKISRAENGEWGFGFAPPPGWSRDVDGRLVVDPYEAEAVRWLILQVIAGRSNWRELGREVVAGWPELGGRRGGGRLADRQEIGNALKRGWLNPRFFDAYTANTYRVEFIPQRDRELWDEAESTGEVAPSLVEKEYLSVEVDLPPQPHPIATDTEIAALADRLRDIEEDAPKPRRRTVPGIGAAPVLGGVVVDLDTEPGAA